MEEKIEMFRVRKILKAIRDSKPDDKFSGSEIEVIGDLTRSIEQAKEIIDQDKKQFKNSYTYTIWKHREGEKETMVYADNNS